jgi:hypothetical protein
MARVPKKRGDKGSLRAIQWYVNEDPGELDRQIEEASRGGIGAPIDWHSPLQNDAFAEYSDADFIERLRVPLPVRSLDQFWPKGGPNWDAIGTSRNGQVVLVEAKSHVTEIISPPCGAGKPSLRRIKAALCEVAASLEVDSSCDWVGTFYQYTNRLAHLYFLRDVNGVQAWLVQVCFINDDTVDGPKTLPEWQAALQVLQGALGLKKHRLSRNMVEVFPDASRVEWPGRRRGVATD